MKLGSVLFGFLLCLWLVSIAIRNDETNDKAIAEKVAIIETARTSNNPTVIESGKVAEAELAVLQQKRLEKLQSAKQAEEEKIAEANRPMTKEEKILRIMLSAVMALVLASLIILILFRVLR